MIATRLADKFLKPLLDFYNAKNYSVYIGSLTEIIDWSFEFYNEYHLKLNDWGTFETSSENIYEAANREEFLIAWGNNRIQLFYTQKEKG